MEYTYYEKVLFDLGYKVEKDGTCISKSGKILLGTINNGYKTISTKLLGKTIKVRVHRLQPYQKFGEEIYKENIMIRHMDSNSLNNSWDNLKIGTHSDNMMDQSKEIRINKASNAHKKYSDELVIEIKADRDSGYSYKDLMLKYNISSKGTLSNIINVR